MTDPSERRDTAFRQSRSPWDVAAVAEVLRQIAPLELAESWDNVGLLVGAPSRSVRCLMTCLTITPEVVDEAIARRVDLIVTHHPLPFRPLSRLTNETTVGRMLLRLIANHSAVYSAHTAFDSAADGVNQMWAEALDLQTIEPLVPLATAASGPSSPTREMFAGDTIAVGGGRCGTLAAARSLESLATAATQVVSAADCRIVEAGDSVTRVAIACGSGGSFIEAAVAKGCQALITGEATFHACLEARAHGLALILVGHYASERFAICRLARELAVRLGTGTGESEVFASTADVDPLRTLAPAAGQH